MGKTLKIKGGTPVKLGYVLRHLITREEKILNENKSIGNGNYFITSKNINNFIKKTANINNNNNTDKFLYKYEGEYYYFDGKNAWEIENKQSGGYKKNKKKTKKQKKQSIKGGMFKGMFTRSNSNTAAQSIQTISVQIPGKETPIIFNVGDMIKCRFKPNKKNNDTSYYYVVIKKFNNYNGYTPIHMECLPWIVQNNIIKEGHFPSSLQGFLTQKQTLYNTTYSTAHFNIYFSEIEGNDSLRVIDYDTLEFIDNSEYANLESYKSAMGYGVFPMGYGVFPKLNIKRGKAVLTLVLNNKGKAELIPALPTERGEAERGEAERGEALPTERGEAELITALPTKEE
jgi:hypothetical protein